MYVHTRLAFACMLSARMYSQKIKLMSCKNYTGKACLTIPKYLRAVELMATHICS